MKEIPQKEGHEPDFAFRGALPILEGKRNLNNTVLVRVNPIGEEIWRNYWKGKSPLKRDKDGYILMQLFDLVLIFGPHLHTNLAMELPIDPIYYEVDPRYDFRIGRILENDEYNSGAE